MKLFPKIDIYFAGDYLFLKMGPPERYIKDATESKVENKTRSVNITRDHQEYLNETRQNLSKLTRDMLDLLVGRDGWKPKRKGN